MDRMIANIGPGAHVAPGAENLVFWWYGKGRGDVLVRRRRWLSGCALVACSAWAPLPSPAVLAAATPGASADGERATRFLPLFPLGIVAFPGERVLLHIFEPRYKQLIADSADDGINFGIVTIVPGGASSIGTEMRFDRLLGVDESGNLEVETRGLRAFQLKSFEGVVEGKLYSGGQVSFIRNDPGIQLEIQAALVQLYNRMQYRAGSRQTIAAPYPENLSFLIGHDVGLSRSQQLQLLTMPAEGDRQKYLFQHLLRTQ